MRRPEVLIVEDEPSMASALREGFEQDRYSVTVAAGGEMGLELAQKHKYQALVLDVMLPALDGLSVVTELRRTGTEHRF